MDHEWTALCTEQSKLVPSVVHHIHRVGNHVVRIALAADEKGTYSQPIPWSQKWMMLVEENYRASTELLHQYLGTSPIKVPRFIDQADDWKVTNSLIAFRWIE